MERGKTSVLLWFCVIVAVPKFTVIHYFDRGKINTTIHCAHVFFSSIIFIIFVTVFIVDKVIIIIISYPSPARVVGAPQMISQPVFSIFPCSPLPSGTCWTQGLSIPWCCLSTSSSGSLVFVPPSLCLARWFGPDLVNGRHDHTTAVCVSFRWSGWLRVVRLPARW